MSDGPKPMRGEILPPLPRDTACPADVPRLPQGLFGVSLLARARYASEAKQIEAYRLLSATKNALMRVLTEQQKLLAEYEVQRERANNLDDIRETARSQVRSELAGALHTEQIGQFAYEAEIERLQFERDRWRKMRADLNAPTPEPVAPPSIAEQLRAVSEKIYDIKSEFQKHREDIVAKAGGEANLPQAVRDQLQQFELVCDSLIHDAMQKLS